MDMFGEISFQHMLHLHIQHIHITGTCAPLCTKNRVIVINIIIVNVCNMYMYVHVCIIVSKLPTCVITDIWFQL